MIKMKPIPNNGKTYFNILRFIELSPETVMIVTEVCGKIKILVVVGTLTTRTFTSPFLGINKFVFKWIGVR